MMFVKAWCLMVSAMLISVPVSAEELTAFTDYTPLSSNAEIARRMMSPLGAVALARALDQAHTRLSEQPVDLAGEHFLVHVPPQMPAKGYGLLVFIPPWDEAALPQGWSSVLDEFGIIFVSAARSGNEENAVRRRVPLAILAEQNIARHYKLDATRVYIGGFSGGSRVALRIALAYPDIFRGALLNAGSDPIGDFDNPLPPRDLLYRMQEATRLVYVTGSQDEAARGPDQSSMRSMREWCVFDLVGEITPHAVHEVASRSALSHALAALAKPRTIDPADIAACRGEIDHELSGKLSQVEALIAGGKRDEAREVLKAIDLRYGGLAAPRSLELSKMLGAD